jgi:hypothetical protein
VTALEKSAQPSLLAELAGFVPTRGGVDFGDSSLNPAGATYFDTSTYFRVLRRLAEELAAEKSKTDQKPT